MSFGNLEAFCAGTTIELSTQLPLRHSSSIPARVSAEGGSAIAEQVNRTRKTRENAKAILRLRVIRYVLLQDNDAARGKVPQVLLPKRN
jgi:hypothetical protein